MQSAEQRRAPKQRPPLPHTNEMTIIAQDPAVLGPDGRILRARVRVPIDRLLAGPRGHRFHVVDFDTGTGSYTSPAQLAREEREGLLDPGWGFRDMYADADDETLLKDPAFHAQNVYAIAARTLATFEAALGRRLCWSFGASQIYLVPHALTEANAYYDGDDRGIFFGYFDDSAGAPVYTCLSHDIVAHETTHAILDGLRPRFNEPGLPDQAAFHEAFADIVALLSVFSLPSIVEHLLGEPDSDGRIPAERLSPEELRRSALFKLAEQMGDALFGSRGSALRRSIELEPSDAWKSDPAFEEPHRRGEILVAAILQVGLKMWRARLKPLIHDGRLDLARAAEEGARAADHLLRMAIRAIDYCPPLEFEFEDYLAAMALSDSVVAPDDAHGYREALRESFAAFGIGASAEQIRSLAATGIEPVYDTLHFESLAESRDEVFRFIWENAILLGIDHSFYLAVESVRPVVRPGPDNFIVRELIAEYVQTLECPASSLEALGIKPPEDLEPKTRLQMWGGGTIVFDQFGQAKYHHAKPLQDWGRQERRLHYLVSNGLVDRSGRVGFSLGTPRGQRFAEFHASNIRVGESW